MRNLQLAIHAWISRTGTSSVSDLICPKPFENVHATRSVYGKIFRTPPSSHPSLKPGIDKITGKKYQKNGTAGNQSPIKPVCQKMSASGHGCGNDGIPGQVRKNMSGKEKNDTPEAELPGIKDIAETDRRPPDDLVGIGHTQQDTADHQAILFFFFPVPDQTQGR